MSAPGQPDAADDLELGSRMRWPAELLYLHDRYPRESWTARDIGELARFWLAKHASLNTLGALVASAGLEWREGRLTDLQFQAIFVPPLQRFLGDLESHHQVEDGHYFPLFRSAESRLARGFDVLEQDHHTIHAQIDATIAAARALLPQTGQHAGQLPALIERYIAACTPLLGSLGRHLNDEEDLVIPLLADRLR